MSYLKAMRTLLAIRDCGSLTMAADQLNEPKSTLSRRISILESELDERLTCQSGRRLSLTRAGLCYASYCEQILQLESSGRAAIKALKSNLSGRITIGLATELSRGWSTESLHNFTQHYPDIELEVQITECSKLPQDTSPDLWISCCEASSQSSGIKSKQLGYWQQGLYTNTAGNHNISKDDLKDCHWLQP
ncbi:LysR family transcriptional regulator [Vibrio sp. PP-XX7]